MSTKRSIHTNKFSRKVYSFLVVSIICTVIISVTLSMLNTYWISRNRVFNSTMKVTTSLGEKLDCAVQELYSQFNTLNNDVQSQVAAIKLKELSGPVDIPIRDVSKTPDLKRVVLFPRDSVVHAASLYELSEPDAASILHTAESTPHTHLSKAGMIIVYYRLELMDPNDSAVLVFFFDTNRYIFDFSVYESAFDGKIVLCTLDGGILYCSEGAEDIVRLEFIDWDDLSRWAYKFGSGKTISGNRILLSYPGNNIILLFVNSISDNIYQVTDSIWGYVIVAILTATVLLMLGKILIESTTRPLAQLLLSVSNIRHGNLKVRFPPSSIQEIDMLSSELNNMTSTIERLLEDNHQQQKTLYEKERQILWAQLNPHLLYNSMNTIVDTAQHGEIQKVIDITMALSKYFQLTLSRGEDLISIRNEVCHAENYLIIQKIRFESLDYVLDIDDTILNYRIPRLILQPIIENSIYHGIKGYVRDGFISLRGYIKTGYIMIEIKDNGRGIRREELDDLFSNQNIQNTSTGIGLSNIAERLKLYYGKDASLDVSSVFRKGTTVVIRFPIIM